ncbi:MAG: MFS transporter [bacterium]|nr:MFS transporter [bacterium]
MKKRGAEFRHLFLRDMNPVVRLLIISDVVIMGAAGLFGPIFALFVEDFIVGGNEAVAGIAAGVYLFTKSTLQIPIAHLIDRIRGERDDFWLLFVFSMLMGLVPLLYLVIRTPIQLYAVQLVLGIFTAFTFPTFMAMFTRHIDRAKEGTEWGVYFTLVDMMSATFAVVGGYVAVSEGFPALITVVVILSFIGSLLLWPIRPYMRKR